MKRNKWYKILLKEAEMYLKKAPKVSPVHKSDHLKRVWKRSEILCKSLNCDPDVMVAACLLHDLGRHHGLEIHGRKSAELAKPILERHNFPRDKIPKVLDAIAQHDYNFPPAERKSIESKILYDADKMDAFGTVGIYRHLLFIEAGRIRMNEVIPLLEKRWTGLTLIESRKIAKEDYEYTVNFFKSLQKELKEA
ncbi:MAG: HD domain-containing protein [Candidatus Aenigmarchaeota archaeon]|nr:HD domain-containing protein [Candidatus Aenigmarchaeota archaeon]